MVITASMQPKWGRIQLPASNLVLNLFPRRPGSYCVKLARIHSGWPGQVLAIWIWFRSKPVCKNYWAQSRLNAAGLLPVPHSQTRLRSSTESPDHIVQNQPRSSLVLADCVRFGPNGSSPEASRCARIIWRDSSQCFWASWSRSDLACLLGIMHT